MPSLTLLYGVGLHFVAALGGEVTAGQLAPLTPTDKGSAGMTAMVAPSVGWVEPTSRGPRFTLTYTPSAYYRYPTLGAIERPLLLQQLLLGYSPVLARTTTLTLNAIGNVGEVDSSAVAQVFGTSQAAAPDPLVRVISAQLTAQLNHRLSPGWSLNASAPAGYQTTFGGSAEAQGVHDTLNLGLSVGIGRELDRRNTLTLTLQGTAARFQSSDQLSTQMQLGVNHRFTRLTNGHVSAGVGHTETKERNQARNEELNTAAPKGEPLFGVGSAGIATQRQRGNDSIDLIVDARVDPILQTIRPQATLTLNSTQILNTRSGLNWSGSLTTVTASEPVPQTVNTLQQNETAATSSVALYWQHGDLTWRYGIRASVRGPHWSEPFEARERVFVGFVGLAWGIAGPGIR